MKIYLTPEQSGRLIELGVDTKLASCEQYVCTGEMNCGIELPPVPKPVFRLDDVISILPKEIDTNDNKYYLNINVDENGSEASYVSKSGQYWLECYQTPELIDSLYQLLCWTVEQKYYNPKNKQK